MGNTFKFLFEYNDYIQNIENNDKDNYIYNEILKRSKFGRLAIVEGFIFTHPADKSIDIIKSKVVKSEIEELNDILIKNGVDTPKVFDFNGWFDFWFKIFNKKSNIYIRKSKKIISEVMDKYKHWEDYSTIPYEINEKSILLYYEYLNENINNK